MSLALSSPGGYTGSMKHHSHPDISKRLKRAHGHLASVIEMIEAGRPCTDLAQQLFAVESAITNAKRELIHDHMEHCLGDGIRAAEMTSEAALAEFRTLAKYL
jgi:DNA-binding FrmR family transcriptional regulator